MSLDETTEQIELNESLENYEWLFSVRAVKAFRRLGVETLGDLVQKSAWDFLVLRNCGATTLKQIQGFLDSRGYGLREEGTLEEVSKYAAKGMTRKEIAEETGLSYNYVCELVSLCNAGVKSKKLRKLDKIHQLACEGLTRREIAEETGLSYSYVYELVSLCNAGVKRGTLGMPRNMSARRKIVRLAKRGLSLKQIGLNVGVTRERVRQIINSEDKHDEWILSRKGYEFAKKRPEIEEMNRKKTIGNIAQTAFENSFRNDGYDDWAIGKAQERFRNVRQVRHSTPFDVLVEFFQRYKDANDCGEKRSASELTQGLNLSIQTAGKIFQDVSLEPMHGKLDRHVTPMEKKKAIVRAYELEMNSRDIAYFLGVNSPVVNNNWRVVGLVGRRTWSRNNKAIKVFRRGFSDRTHHLTYRLASQIYEARDLESSWNEKDIAELLDTSLEVVTYANENRDEIEPKIIESLKVLYPNQEVSKPYVNFCSEKLKYPERRGK